MFFSAQFLQQKPPAPYELFRGKKYFTLFINQNENADNAERVAGVCLQCPNRIVTNADRYSIILEPSHRLDVLIQVLQSYGLVTEETTSYRVSVAKRERMAEKWEAITGESAPRICPLVKVSVTPGAEQTALEILWQKGFVSAATFDALNAAIQAAQDPIRHKESDLKKRLDFILGDASVEHETQR